MKTKKNEQINVPGIVFDKNIIIYEDSFISTENISMITICQIPANNTWIIALLIGVIGLYMLNTPAIGALMILVSVIWIFWVLNYNANRGENLAITLNSGNTLYFNCKSRDFLNKVINTITTCIKEKNNSKFVISFDKCQINGNVFNDSKFS